MNRLLSLTVFLLPLSVVVPAWAAQDKGEAASSATSEMTAAFEGTIISTYPDGRIGRLWLSEDGSYEAAGRRGDQSSGHWTVRGDKVCLKQTRPLPTPFAFCTPKPSSDHWTAKAVSGEPIQVSLTPGGRPG